MRHELYEFQKKVQSINEIFFYYSGHGFASEDEFFFCATDFNQKRPNETGLSQADLHDALRAAQPELVVKIIDACQSGTILIKADVPTLRELKRTFNNFIQIASCLSSQLSLTGDPLSLFTGKFISAALKKVEGQIYYSDIIAILRDDFLENSNQTPYFTTQATQREIFVEDAKCLDPLRMTPPPGTDEIAAPQEIVQMPPPTPLDILRRAEGTLATKAAAQGFILRLTGNIKAKVLEIGFNELFDTFVTTHSNFVEPTARSFIISVLRNEKRHDEFVEVSLKDKYRRRSPFDLLAGSLVDAARLYGTEDIGEQYDLELNCRLEGVQLTITLTPKFVALRQCVLVITCAPSLENCYVFELLTEHLRRDWEEFDAVGTEIVRRWYKMKWTDPCEALVDKIFDQMRQAVEKSVASAARVLEED